MNKQAKIYVAGHRGLAGSAILRSLQKHGYQNIVIRTHQDLDLTRQRAVQEFMENERPAFVFVAAALVGGIHANSTYPADFIRDNLQIQTNIIDSAYRSGTRKLVFLGSSCIYPRLAPQPMKEDALLTGPLEPTNEWYAIAKIAGIKMCQAYWQQYGFRAISLMPTNLYGPGDNFSLKNSHVLPALLRKFHEAKEGNSASVEIWGTGNPRREFLHVDDLGDAAVFLMQNYESPEIINVGTGQDLSIRELAETIADIVGFKGSLRFDSSKPDGTPRKLLDVSRLVAAGWHSSIPLQQGIAATYSWFLQNQDTMRH